MIRFLEENMTRLDREMLTKSQRHNFLELKRTYVSMRLEHFRANTMNDTLCDTYGGLVVRCNELMESLPKEITEPALKAIDTLFVM